MDYPRITDNLRLMTGIGSQTTFYIQTDGAGRNGSPMAVQPSNRVLLGEKQNFLDRPVSHSIDSWGSPVSAIYLTTPAISKIC